MAASAQEYTTDRIRNVVLLGHGGSGKTTLTDAMCYIGGSTSRRGSVEAGNAITDFTPEETAHGMSINLGVAHALWMDSKVNLVDTPGYLDFYGETMAGVRVADGALVVVSAVSGVEAGTEKVWAAAADRGLPRLIFVSMMDKENASFEKTFGQIKSVVSEGAIPVEIPIGAGDDYRGIVNLFSQKAHLYRKGSTKGEYDEVEIPEELRPDVERYRQELIETIATTDDTLLEAYLEGEELDRVRVLTGMASAMRRGELFPVFCGSARSGQGVRAVLNKLVELVPSPGEGGPYLAEDRSGDLVELEGKDSEPAAALVFKTASEPHAGELSYFRVFAGTVSNGDSLANASRSGSERVAHLAIPNGADRLEVGRLHAGDIGVVAKLKLTHTGDTLASDSRPVRLQAIAWPEPDIAVAVAPVSRGDEDRLSTGLARLHEEDPTFRAAFDSELGQTIARGLGELHLNVTFEKLRRKYGVEVRTEEPRIPYRETLTREAEGQGRYKKQTGGRGQYGDCWIRLRPLSHGSGYEFVDAIKGGVIPNKFVPAVNHGIRDAAARGILAGYPVVDFQAEVYDGSHHSVDSSEQAFKVAGSMAFKKVAQLAGPVLLEPIMEIEVTTPEEFMGDIMGDLNGRRGRVLGIEARGHLQLVRALVPQAELYRYSAVLRSLTHGKGVHTRRLKGYERAPADVTQRVIAQSQEERQAS
jgi:elongation factor G